MCAYICFYTYFQTEDQLSLPEAEFLLTDLNCKLEHVFGTSNKRASFFGNSQEKSKYFLYE